MLNKGNLKTCIEIFFQTMYLDFLKRSTKVCAIKKTITSLNFGQFLHLSIAYILFSLIFFFFHHSDFLVFTSFLFLSFSPLIFKCVCRYLLNREVCRRQQKRAAIESFAAVEVTHIWTCSFRKLPSNVYLSTVMLGG